MKELTVDALIANIEQVTEFIDEDLRKNGCPNEMISIINVAVDEIFANIAMYAYPAFTGQAVITSECGDKKIKLSFTDNGIYFNPLEKEDPDITLSAAEREIGGLGVFLVKTLMENVEYERVNNKNVIKMEKSWGNE